tara:strand:+ start:162 stop:473 length:312 start_codon:yes stop_codon:yes gene_type:complete
MQQNIQQIHQHHLAFNEQVKNHPLVANTRCKGTIFALDLSVEMSRYGNLRDKIYNYFMSKGIYLRPLGKTIYIACPYVISKSQLHRIYEAILNLLDELREDVC